MASKFLGGVLQQIHESQKGYTVKTSVHLKKIEEYLSSKNCPKLTHSDLDLLFNGIPQQKVQGLYGLAGVKGTFGGLKKSAFYALQIIYKTITTGSNREVAAKYFSESDEEDFKLLRLATHISEDKSKTALKLCGFLKDKRPYLSENNYIYSEEGKKTFHKWHADNSKQRKREPKESIQTPKELITPSSVLFTPQKIVKEQHQEIDILTNFAQMEFLDYEIISNSQQQYLMDTFVDPIDIWNHTRNSSEKRTKIRFKQYMIFLVQTPISRVPASRIQSRIMEIHMESPQFDPAALVEHYHRNLSQKNKHEIAKEIPLHMGADCNKNLVLYFFKELLSTHGSIGSIKDNFDKVERIRNEGNIGFSLRTKMKNSMNHLSSQVEPLHEKYTECERLRNLIVFLQQNSQFTKLAKTIQTLVQHDKIDRIPLLFSRHKSLIELYRNKPILRGIIECIEGNMLKARVKQLSVVLNEFDVQQAAIFVGLFSDPKAALTEYIVPKMVSYLLSELGCTTNETHELEKCNKRFELINFKDVIQIKKKGRTQEFVDEEGDLLEQFLSQLNKEQEGYRKQCQYFQENIEKLVVNFETIVSQWSKKYNIFFQHKSLLVQAMLNWCSLITEQIETDINDSERRIDDRITQQQSCIKIVCRMLLIIEKYIDHRNRQQQLEELKSGNLALFCKLLRIQIKAGTELKPCLARRDCNANYYNEFLAEMAQKILLQCSKIKSYPSFTEAKYNDQLHQFVCACFEVDDSYLGKLPEILTYSCAVQGILHGSFMQPFYNQFEAWKALRKKLTESMNSRSHKLKLLLYSYIKIEYCAVMAHSKYTNFSAQMLDLLNQHVFMISEYAVNNYRKLTSFFLESLLNEIQKMHQDKVEFYQQLYLIRAMTNKISNKRIDERWEEILGKSGLTAQSLKQVENEVLMAKYKNSVTLKALYE